MKMDDRRMKKEMYPLLRHTLYADAIEHSVFEAMRRGIALYL
jgi:hypothetical protein